MNIDEVKIYVLVFFIYGWMDNGNNINFNKK